MHKLKILRIISVNIILLIVFLVGIEFLARIIFVAKVDIFDPIKSFKKIGKVIFLNRGGHWEHLNQGNMQRKPYPYLMFKGAPNFKDHNILGYRIFDEVTNKTINIAFFGGSTGYAGSPPIINKITDKLNSLNYNFTKYAPLNFSVVSSNHNQHLHSLLHHYKNYPIDLVFFYGGYNETLQTAFYDSRPGYPYNFKVRNEMSPEEMFLMKNSYIYQTIRLKLLKNSENKPFSEIWNKKIVNNYINTIETARLLSNSLTTGRCEIPFIFAYQPYQMSKNKGVHNSFKEQVHSRIKKYVSIASDGIDVSNSFHEEEKFYEDIVHLIPAGREIVAKNIFKSKIFLNAIKSCKL